jgi:hypothetical protein
MLVLASRQLKGAWDSMLINPTLRARPPAPARTIRRSIEPAAEKRREPDVSAREHDRAARSGKAASGAVPTVKRSTDLLA